MTGRLFQFALIASTLAYSWLGMQIVHEFGHVLAAYAGGETVKMWSFTRWSSPVPTSRTTDIRCWSSGAGRSSAHCSH